MEIKQYLNPLFAASLKELKGGELAAAYMAATVIFSIVLILVVIVIFVEFRLSWFRLRFVMACLVVIYAPNTIELIKSKLSRAS